MKKLLLITLVLISHLISADEINKMATIDGETSSEIATYSQKTCKDIYEAIGIFLYLADEEWKQENEEKAMFYLKASANYSTIYQTVCRKPKKLIKIKEKLDEDLLDMYYKMPTFLLDN